MDPRKTLAALCGFLLCSTAFAQGAPAAPAECARPAGAPAWLPCGPDRVLSEPDIGNYVVKAGEATKMEMTGGTSGRKFALHLRPDSKLDMGLAGGTNIGRDWKVEGGKLCLRAYQNVWGGKFNCGALELAGGRLFWVETLDAGSRNPIDALSFSKP